MRLALSLLSLGSSVFALAYALIVTRRQARIIRDLEQRLATAEELRRLAVVGHANAMDLAARMAQGRGTVASPTTLRQQAQLWRN